MLQQSLLIVDIGLSLKNICIIYRETYLLTRRVELIEHGA